MHPLRRAALALVALASCTGDSHGIDATTDTRVGDAFEVTDTPPDFHVAVDTVEDLGMLSLPSPTVVGRDGASSGVRGNRIVWTFGDAFLSSQTPDDMTNVRSATAGWATIDSPLALTEPVNDAGIPEQLIPYTPDELAANRMDALNGWALWPGAVIDTGATDLLVLFQRIKRTNGSGFDGVALGTARLPIGSTRAIRNTGDLFQRPFADASVGVESTALYGAVGVSVIDGTAYFFGSDPAPPLNGGCGVARVPVGQADQRSAFTFYDGSGWSSDPSRAVPVFSYIGSGVSVTFNPYVGRYIAVTAGLAPNDVMLVRGRRAGSSSIRRRPG